MYCLYLNSTVGHVGDALVRPDHQLDGDRPAGAERAAVPLLVEPVHRLEDLEELEHALQVAEHCVLPEVLLDQLPQWLWLVGVDHTLGKELVEANLNKPCCQDVWKVCRHQPTSFSRYSKLDFLSRAICGMSLKNLRVAQVKYKRGLKGAKKFLVCPNISLFVQIFCYFSKYLVVCPHLLISMQHSWMAVSNSSDSKFFFK